VRPIHWSDLYTSIYGIYNQIYSFICHTFLWILHSHQIQFMKNFICTFIFDSFFKLSLNSIKSLNGYSSHKQSRHLGRPDLFFSPFKYTNKLQHSRINPFFGFFPSGFFCSTIVVILLLRGTQMLRPFSTNTQGWFLHLWSIYYHYHILSSVCTITINTAFSRFSFSIQFYIL
jgi:hypothetical protein